MTVPDVSVIIGAYNAMPYLTRCVTSVVEQTIGQDRMEIITIDDGSTDGTGEELDRLATAHPGLLRVRHQKNSGGPGGPRNVGLDLARGRYVFFLDADDYLGAEALERMVAMADANASDVVLGKMVGVGGRSAPTLAYKEHLERTDVFSSRVYWNLTVMKLFRRDMIERLGLRFMTDLRLRQDQPFCAMAYLHAANISVITDYDCVYWVFREDGENISRKIKGTAHRVRALGVMLELLGEHVPTGRQRDKLMYRHLVTELRTVLSHLCEEELETAERDRLFAEVKRLLNTWHSESLAARLPAIRRLHYHLARQGTLEQLCAVREYVAQQMARNGDERLRNGQGLLPERVLIEDGLAYACYPFFRDDRTGIPDSIFECTRELEAVHRIDSAEITDSTVRITGHAGLRRVEGDTLDVVTVLRERRSRAEHLFPAECAPGTAQRTDFETEIDLATAVAGKPLPEGVWDLWLELRIAGLAHRVRIGHKKGERVDGRTIVHAVPLLGGTGVPVALYSTAKFGNLTLDLGGSKYRPLGDFTVDTVSWAPGGRGCLRVEGTLAHRYAGDSLRLLATGGPAESRAVPLCFSESSARFSADLPLDTPGEWTVSIAHEAAGCRTTADVAAPVMPAVARWYRFGLPRYAKPLRAAPALTVRVGTVDVLKAVLKVVRRG
ncbi:glycosyltransferase family 2 protein [Streptomyces sodiiphilus]|uniref:Glycosyltransferase family 2 protein n=1 Tax=Streptomyces sodiiphilus TaxID=226217 RepID=A0ABP5B7Z4_9ACTN